MDTTLKYTGQVMNFFTKKHEDKKRKALFFGLFDDDETEQQPKIITTNSTRRSSNASESSKLHVLEQVVGSPGSVTGSLVVPSAVGGDGEINFDINDLDITNDDFEELIGDLDTLDLDAFQQDELVQQAIQDGVDLREYSKHIEDDLRKIETQSIDDCTYPNYCLFIVR